VRAEAALVVELSGTGSAIAASVVINSGSVVMGFHEFDVGGMSRDLDFSRNMPSYVLCRFRRSRHETRHRRIAPADPAEFVNRRKGLHHDFKANL